LGATTNRIADQKSEKGGRKGKKKKGKREGEKRKGCPLHGMPRFEGIISAGVRRRHSLKLFTKSSVGNSPAKTTAYKKGHCSIDFIHKEGFPERE